MSKFRLKREAVEFFQSKYTTAVHELSTWSDLGVDEKALEKVEPAHITYGHKNLNNSSANLAGWGGEDGSHFHFTIHFPSMKFMEYDHFKKGKMTRKLMNEIQDKINYFYSEFQSSETDK